MSLEATRKAARQGRLYPSVILYGADAAARLAAAVDLARTLLCEAAPEERPCGVCRHCRRIAVPDAEGAEGRFHPDFQMLQRDLKTSTSVEATREFLKTAQVSPFEARGQVFVVASAETLSGEAANALLKSLEEPHVSAPRNFFLLAPSRLDLLPTLRSRSLAVFLGPAEPLDTASVEPLARGFAAALEAYAGSGAPIYLLSAAEALVRAGEAMGKAAGEAMGKTAGEAMGKTGGWEDPRAGRPWALAASAVLRSLDTAPAAGSRRGRLALAEALLEGPSLRLRSVSAERILEGLVSKYLASGTGI